MWQPNAFNSRQTINIEIFICHHFFFFISKQYLWTKTSNTVKMKHLQECQGGSQYCKNSKTLSRPKDLSSYPHSLYSKSSFASIFIYPIKCKEKHVKLSHL